MPSIPGSYVDGKTAFAASLRSKLKYRDGTIGTTRVGNPAKLAHRVSGYSSPLGCVRHIPAAGIDAADNCKPSAAHQDISHSPDYTALHQNRWSATWTSLSHYVGNITPLHSPETGAPMMSARSTAPESPSSEHFPNQWTSVAVPPDQPWDIPRQWNTATLSHSHPLIQQSAIMLTSQPSAATMLGSVSALCPEESVTPSRQHDAHMIPQSSDHALNTIAQHTDTEYNTMSQNSSQWISHVDWEALNRFYADQVVPETPHGCHSNWDASYTLPLKQNCNSHGESLTASLFTRVRFRHLHTVSLLFHESANN